MKQASGLSALRRLTAAAGLAVVLGGLPFGATMAAPADEVRAAFERFVAAQNAHDEKAVAGLLLASRTSSGSRAERRSGEPRRR